VKEALFSRRTTSWCLLIGLLAHPPRAVSVRGIPVPRLVNVTWLSGRLLIRKIRAFQRTVVPRCWLTLNRALRGFSILEQVWVRWHFLFQHWAEAVQSGWLAV